MMGEFDPPAVECIVMAPSTRVSEYSTFYEVISGGHAGEPLGNLFQLYWDLVKSEGRE